MKKILFFLSSLCIITTIGLLAQQPIIISISPITATPGTPILIQGNNFGTSITSLNVWFGPVKGTITTATNTSLTVTVPMGAAEQQIMLVKDSFTIHSSAIFKPTFNGGTNSFSSNAFGKIETQLPSLHPFVFDFDEDGLPDYAAVKGASSLAFYRNSGQIGRFVFDLDTTLSPGNKTLDMAVADFNGDKKPDLAIVVSSIYSYFIVYPNTSSPGNISFGTPFTYNIGTDNPINIATTDVDGNGKPDVLVSYGSSGTAFTVIRNTTAAGNISFSSIKTNVGFGLGQVGSGNKLYIADLDKDGKQDVTVLSGYFRPLFIYRNTSTIGTISFGPKINLETGRPFAITGGAVYDLRITDMDADQKVDLVFAHSDADTLSIYRNTSVSGNISFGSRNVFKTTTIPRGMTTGDVNGDARPDILFLTNYDSLCVIRNLTTAGNFILDTAITYQCGYPIQTINTRDLDLDGKMDILVSGTDYGGQNQHICNILRNKINGPSIKAVIPITADEGTPITVTGTRFTGTTLVTLGDSSTQSFTIINDTTLLLVTGNGNSGDVFIETSTGKDRYPDFTFSPPIPSIDSVVPRSGYVGTTARIYGRKFSATEGDNEVYFGSTKVTVLDASDSTINVLVPAGGSTDPIRIFIKSRGLQAQTDYPFVVTRVNADTSFRSTQFGDTLQYSVSSYPTSIKTADLNDDEKTDMVSAIYFNTNRLSVFRNRSDSALMLFDLAKDYSTYSGSFGGGSASTVRSVLADMNGDGKPDMIAVSAYPDSLSVFMNNSQGAEINFIKKRDFITGSDPVNLAAADMDLDGIPDVACINATAGTVSVFKNISKRDSVMLKTKIDYPTGVGSQDLILQDLNGDKKPELVITNYNQNTVTIYVNKSTCGTIAFSGRITFATGSGPWYVKSDDVDGDRKPDILTQNVGSKTISILRNISTSDSISFEPKIDYSFSANLKGLAVGDLTGDGKPDMVVSTNQYPSSLSFFRNLSAPGQIQFSSRFDLTKIGSPLELNLTDLTHDGQLDIVAGNDNKKMVIVPNRMGMPVYGNMCREVDTLTLFSDITGLSYQWQIDSGNGFANITSSSFFTGINTQSLKLWNAPSTWYGYRFRCVVGDLNSLIYQLRFVRKWTGAVSAAWENPQNWACGQVPDANCDVIIYSGNIVINSQVVIRSLLLRPAAVLKVNDGYRLQTK